MTEVILHGALGKKFGRSHCFNIGKPVDAIRALMANKKGFRRALRTWGKKGRLYEIVCDGELIENETELLNKRRLDRVEIVPTIVGTSKAVKIIVGVVLIVVGVILEFYFPGNPFSGYLYSMGAGLILGGVLEILFPVQTPSFHTDAATRSFLFSSTTNSTTRGGAVQIGYGRVRTGSQVISTVLEPSRMGGGNANGGWNGGYGGQYGWAFLTADPTKPDFRNRRE